MQLVIPAEIRAWRWRIFAATWASYAGYYFCRKPFYIAKASLGDAHGWSPQVLANIGAAYLVAYMVGQFVAGYVGTRWGPRLNLLLGMGISIGCNVAFGLTDHEVAFGVLMVLNGLAQATGWSSNVGTMGQWYGRLERGTVMGWWGTNYQLGGIAANTLASWVLQAMGYRWSFFTGAALLLVAWAMVLLFQRNRPEDVGLPPMPPDNPVDAAGQPEVESGWTPEVATNTILIGVFYFFVKFIRYALWSWAPYVLQNTYHLPPDHAGYLSTAFDLTGLPSVIVIGFLSDRYFAGRRVAISVIFLGAMTFAAGLLWVGSGASVAAFVGALGVIGFCLFGPDALMSGVAAMEVGSRRTAVAATGIINGMGSAGGVVQEFVFGALLASGGMTAAFGTLVGSAALATLCLGVLLVRGWMGKSRI
jgi:OPA family sugar phosphate sensor protein UhpC-like MFS transporter